MDYLNAQMPRRRGSRWRIAGTAAAVILAGFLIALASVVPFSSETARRKVIAVLAAHLDAEVELRDLRFRVLPQFHAEGHGLTIRHKGRRDVPPLISVSRFSAEGSVLGLLRRHIARVELEGLDIEIPPDRNRDDARTDATSAPQRRPDESKKLPRTFVVDSLESTDGRLVIIPSEAHKVPKIWSLHTLRLSGVSADRAMPFTATLGNAVPPGDIATSGSFGPWQAGAPGKTPVDGQFTFAHADLSVFKGISGILSAKGTFGGMLERIDIRGETDTPDFAVTVGAHPMPLHAVYHAVVDGTNGNTELSQIDASFLKTSVVAKGGVFSRPGVDGRVVTLDVLIDNGRLEDVLWMAVAATPAPMTGVLKLQTTFVLPPGDRDVVQKLLLNGTFSIAATRFASSEIQTKINELSHRTRGQSPVQKTERVSSQFAGAFKLANGVLELPHVTFDIPGSAVRLAGRYGLVSEKIDFSGDVLTDAKVSQMTTGYKSVLLKPVDPIFGKDGGGSSIPVKITGTRAAPSFGLDKGRVFKK
jgi:hypothetical protein